VAHYAKSCAGDLIFSIIDRIKWEVFLGKQFSLTTADQHKLGAYRADPQGTPKGGLVVIQEIFGVNNHIRTVCDRLAALGYVAVAPAVFDRFVRDFESGYTPDEIAHARSYLGNLNWDHMLADMAAAQGDLKGVGPLGVIGFCMGGTAAFLAACRLPGLSAAVSYYGGMIGKFADEKPKCPLQMHFGEKDEGIPMSAVEEIKKKQPQAETYVYPGAAHGFYCDERASYNKDAAALAWGRTQEFLTKNMKK
jgi:carboxymethylenebutenolidase